MANLLQKIVWLLMAIAWAAPAAPFSHKIHLEKKLACVVCHSRANTSVKAEDNLLPNPTVCSGCHHDARQVKALRPLTVSKFNHQLHLKLEATACVTCHRGLELSDEVSLAVFPKMAECLVCHQPIEPPYSCEKCHSEGQALKPVTHTNEWLEAHSKRTVVKDKESCAVCHGREFKCMGCH